MMSEPAASVEHTIITSEGVVEDVVAAPRAYMYQVHVRRRRGFWKRWQGRVVTRDLQGTRRFWPWRLSHDRDRLVQQLWEETMRDIQWRNSDTPVEIVEVS